MTHYMFRTVFPSIIRSSRLYIQQQAFVKLYKYITMHGPMKFKFYFLCLLLESFGCSCVARNLAAVV